MRTLAGLLGLAMIGVGAIVAVDGLDGVVRVAQALVAHVGVVLVALAIVLLAHNMAPAGTWVGPLTVGGVGVAILAWQHGWGFGAIWAAAGGMMMLVGGRIVMSMRFESEPIEAAPVRRLIGVLARRRLGFTSTQHAPERLRILAVGARIDIDMRAARLPAVGPVEVLISCWEGAVKLQLPQHWAVVAGRVTTGRAIRLAGVLDSSEVFEDPENQADRLGDIAEERRQATNAPAVGAAIVVHVLGLGGAVTILRS